MVLWATVTALELDGTNFGTGNNADGTGPVTLNNFIPTNAVPTEVIPVFVTDLPTSIETTMREQIELYRNFGLGYERFINGMSFNFNCGIKRIDNFDVFFLIHFIIYEWRY